MGQGGGGMFIIVGGIACVTIHVLNCVNAYEDLDAQAFMIYMPNLAFESPRNARHFTQDNSFRINVIIAISCPVSKLYIEAFVIALIVVIPQFHGHGSCIVCEVAQSVPSVRISVGCFSVGPTIHYSKLYYVLLWVH